MAVGESEINTKERCKMNLQTIQKISKDSGIHHTSIEKMIKNNKLIAYKQDGFKRILIDLDEFNSTFKPINNICEDFNLDIFNI